MKRVLTLWITAASLGITSVFAEPPPAPPAPPPPAAPAIPPVPPVPSVPPWHREHPAGPTTFLGVGVEMAPDWLGDQLNLPAGFGLIVNYVVPGGPAEKAGVKPHDIIKQINDQMLANADQLTALVQSMADGQDVSLLVVRKGQETKLTAKLEKKQAYTPDMTVMSASDAAEDFKRLSKPPAREILDQLGPEVHSAMKDAGRKAADLVRREIMIFTDNGGQISSTKMDLSHGRILIRDDQGEVELKGHGPNAVVSAKDPTGKTIYTGAAKDAPPGTLDRIGKIGMGGNTVITGDKVTSYEMEDNGDDKDGKPVQPASPATSPTPAP